MKITVITIGHKFETFEEEWIEVYQKRLKHYVAADWIRLNPKKKFSDADLISEIEKKSQPGSQIVLLDESGKSMNTGEIKTWIEKLEVQSQSHICFVIGESHGFSQTLLKKFPFHLSLSKLTFPHKLAMLVLFEQLYRVYSWKAGSPYHHS
jgi:23S rRNA (pseudouridine1915-N3)-methyltransferase